MSSNVGTADRIVRVLLAILLFSLLLVLDGPARFLGLIGLVPLLTGLAGFCPLYRVFGLSTCPLREERGSQSA